MPRSNGGMVLGQELRVRLGRGEYRLLVALARSQGVGPAAAAEVILRNQLRDWAKAQATLTAVEAPSIATGIQVDRGGGQR